MNLLVKNNKRKYQFCSVKYNIIVDVVFQIVATDKNGTQPDIRVFVTMNFHMVTLPKVAKVSIFQLVVGTKLTKASNDSI